MIKNNLDQSQQGESVMSRRRRKADYHCLDPWTAITSEEWHNPWNNYRKAAYCTRMSGNGTERWKQRPRCSPPLQWQSSVWVGSDWIKAVWGRAANGKRLTRLSAKRRQSGLAMPLVTGNISRDDWTWTLLKSKAGGAAVKSLSGNCETEHGGTALSLRGGISEAVANPRRRCRVSVFRSCPWVGGCQKVSVRAPSPFDGITHCQ